MIFIPRSQLVLPLAAVLGCALFSTPALAKNAPPGAPAAGAAANAVIAVDAVRDSVTVTGLGVGAATVEVRRAGVVIGIHSDNVNASQPLTVNTFAPTAAKASGDCWERGVLPVGLTPDIRPLDVVSVVGGPSVTVPSDAATATTGIAGGPLGGCSAIAPFALNAVQGTSPAAFTSGAGQDLVISGAAQPLATAVSVSLGDGASSTAPVNATLNGTTWTATIPAAAVERLANGTLTATARYTVPDVSTGAPAQIDGAPLTLTKRAAIAGVTAPAATTPTASAPSSQRPSSVQRLHVISFASRSRIHLRTARRSGVRASFAVPALARYARLELKKGRRTIARRSLRVQGGSTQVAHLSGARLRKGSYRLVIRVGTTAADLGAATTKVIRVI